MSAVTVFGEGGSCQGTDVRSQVVSWHMPVRQLNGGCIEGYCPGQYHDRPTLAANSQGPASVKRETRTGSMAEGPSVSEFDSCQEIVREIIPSGKTVHCLFYVWGDTSG